VTPGARLSAAIEILADWQKFDGPVERVIESWGRAHRFAGSKDRAAIAERVYAVFRRRGDLVGFMADDAPRALVLGSVRLIDGLDLDAINALCAMPHAPAPPNADERSRLGQAVPEAGLNLPEWLVPFAIKAFGSQAADEMAAMGRRAPFDLRVNRLNADRETIRHRLAQSNVAAEPCRFVPDGLRLEKNIRLDALDVMQDGSIEPMDEGSQLAAVLVDARPGQRVLDLCAGAGGKALALAAIMGNQGEIHADDRDAKRLTKLDARAWRAGARNISVTKPSGLYDRVLVDAPCSGSGTWRRSVDARWRLTPATLSAYGRAQEDLLIKAADLTRPGGLLIYVTCSWIAAENQDRVEKFLTTRPDFTALSWRVVHADTLGGQCAIPDAPDDTPFLSLSTARHDTDGFFIAILKRSDPA
jgi:16S rRNA (cytosine967-C5)-methyltransferase